MSDFKFNPEVLNEPEGQSTQDNSKFKFDPDSLKPDLTAPIEDAIHYNPDDHAKNKMLSDETGLPTSAIEQDQKTVENQVKSRQIKSSLEKHKFTATWVTEDDNAKLAHDDIENLGKAENMARGMGERIGDAFGGVLTATNTIAADLEKKYGLGTFEIKDGGFRYVSGDELQERIANGERYGLEVLEDKLKDLDFGHQEEQLATWEDVKSKPLSNVLPFIFEQGILSVPDMAVAIANLPLMTVSMTGRISEERATNEGRKEPTVEDLVKVLPAATVSSFLDRLGGRGILGLDDAVKAVGVKPLAKAVGAGFAKEGATEFTQGSLENVGATLGTERGFKIAEMLEQGLQEGLVGSGFGGSIRTVTASAEMANMAIKDSDILKKISSQESKLRERSPAKYAEFQGKLLKDNGVEQISISAEGFAEYNQSGADNSWIETLGLAEKGKLEMYEAMDGDIELTPEQYSLLPPEVATALSRHVRVNDGMTEAEAEAFQETGMQDEINKIAETFQELDPDIKYDLEIIQGKVEEQLQAAGESPETSSYYGVLMAQRYMTRGERSGQNPLELYSRDNLSITQNQESKKTIDNLTIALDIARSEKSKEDYLKFEKQPIVRGIIDSVGGVDPNGRLAGELKSKGITRAMVPGLFKKGGSTDGDNLVRSEFPFFSQVSGDVDLNGYIDPEEIIEAISREAYGEANRTQEELDQLSDFDTAAEYFNSEMEALGVDINKNTDEEILAAFEGQEFNQGGVESEAFKNWFGDSKVVDEDGKPLVVYHGTQTDFDAFDPDMAIGSQFWFTSDKGAIEAGEVGAQGKGVIKEVYLSIENPATWEEYDKLGIGQIIDRGYDGIALEDGGQTTYVAFEPSQIKSVNNRGSFDKNDDRLLYQSGKSIDDNAKQEILSNYRVSRGLKVGKKTKIWRGVGAFGSEAGSGTAVYGQGLYTTADKGYAKDFARDGGRLLEIDQSDLPQNPLRFDTQNDFEIWHQQAQKAMGYDNVRDYNKDWPAFEQFVKALDPEVDGIQLYTGRDAVFVSYDAPEYYQDNRASIRFNNSGININLGMGSDRSSFLHESGHLFLEQLRQDQQDFGVNSPELVDDWNIINKWWGNNSDSLKKEAIDFASKAKDSDAVDALAGMSDAKVKEFVVTGNLDRGSDAQGYLSIAMHEQWARGVEDYFRTGQAPSIALQDAFNRFRAWLVSIYKKATGKGGLDIKFSDDVRSVMDRLIATDEEIDLMASQYDMKSMFGSAEEIGMTPGQFKKYQMEVARSVEEGKTRQLKKHINDIERERQKWWIDEREKIKSEVEKEVHDRKDYKLMYDLTNGTKPNGDPLESRRNRMDRKAINAILENDDSAKRLPKVQGKVLYATAKKEGKTHPDIVAMVYGYQNSRDMLIELMNVEPMNDVINAEADAIMKAKHGDMKLPDQAEAQAIESIHGDKRGDVLVSEVNALRQGQAKMKSAFVRQWAKEQIGKHKVDNIKPTKFLSAEKKYSKIAAKEFKAGNMLEAQRAKFRQMMNHFMGKESYKVRTEMEKSRNYMRKFNQKKKLFKSIDADYVDRIKEILGSYQLGPRLSDKKRRQISSEAFVKWMEDQAENEGAIFNVPQEILDADEKTHYRDLSLDEFRTLSDSIKNIEAQGRLKKKALIAGELIDIQQMENDIVSRLENIPTKKVEEAKAIRQDPSFKDSATERFHSFDASLRKVEFLMEFMDGEGNGPAHKAFFQPVADAEAQKNDIVKQVNEVFMEKLAALPKDVRKGLGRDNFVPSLGREMNRGNLIMLALNIGNESNLDKTIRGSEQEGAGWTEDGIMEALDVLTKEEWDFVQSVWDSFDKIYPQVQEIYRRENGVSPEKIEPKKIDTKHGEYTGRYFPMMYDPRRSVMSRDLEGKSALEAMQSQTVKAGVFSGMTKARTNFAAPVLLDISAVPNHVRRMAHYVSHYETVRLTRKLLSRKTLSTAITAKLGENYYRELKAWIGDVAADGQTDKALNFWDKAVEAMRTNVTIAIMGLSYTTGASQLLGWAQSIDALGRQEDGSYKPQKGGIDMAWGLKRVLTEKGIVDNVMEVSGEMRHRIDNIDRDLSHAMKQLSGKRGAWKKFQRSTLMHIAYIQFYSVDMPAWLAAQDKALKEGKSESEAIKSADSLIRKTQTAGGTKDLSQIQRQRGLMNAFTMFYSFFNLLYNVQARAIGDTNFKKPTDVAKFAARAAVVLILPTALEAMMRGEAPDDEESYIKWLAIKSTLYSATSIAFVRDLTGIAEGFGYSNTPLDSIPKEMAKAIKEIAKAYDEGEMTKETAVKAFSAAGFASGFPVLQPKRFIDALEKWDEDGTMPDTIEFLRGPDDD